MPVSLEGAATGALCTESCEPCVERRARLISSWRRASGHMPHATCHSVRLLPTTSEWTEVELVGPDTATLASPSCRSFQTSGSGQRSSWWARP